MLNCPRCPVVKCVRHRGDDVCCTVVFGTLVGVIVFSVMWSSTSSISDITTLFNLSATTCRIPAIWKSSLIIPIPKPGKDTSQGTSYRPISLICPAAKVMESLFLPTINKYLIPAQDQHGFRCEHWTTSALL